VDDLAAFLAARLDEDEAAAKAAKAPSPWKAAEHEADNWIVTDAAGEPLIYDEGTPSLEEAAHIARHDPARVLREVEAKRTILAEHDPCYPTYYPTPSGQPTCGVCHSGGFDWDPERWPCATVRALAVVYGDHPDYRPEWKP
jgi:hypothetical protein